MFKDRHMWMAGFHDEDKFDAFAKTLTLDGLAGKITCPYLSVAGEDDDSARSSIPTSCTRA